MELHNKSIQPIAYAPADFVVRRTHAREIAEEETGEKVKMKFLEKLRIKAKSLKKQLTAVYYAYQDPKVKLLPKIIIAISLGYALSPIDLIPDFIPVIGYLDDLIIVPALISLAIKMIPEEVMDEARRKAEAEPLILKKNWLFATIFIFIWVLLLVVIIISIVKLFDRN